jgi:hypothetical protein
LVEQPIRNRQVSGSTPLVGSRIGFVHAGLREFSADPLLFGPHLGRATSFSQHLLLGRKQLFKGCKATTIESLRCSSYFSALTYGNEEDYRFRQLNT